MSATAMPPDPSSVFKTWLGELAKERDVLNRPTTLKPTRISRSEFLEEYKSALARRLKVFTNRENVALSREALRNVLVDGRLVLQPDVANAHFEGTLTLSHEELLKEKQIDKVGSEGRFELYSVYPICLRAVPASVAATG